MAAVGQLGQSNHALQLKARTQQIVAETVQGAAPAGAVDQAQMSDELLDEVNQKGGEGNANVEEMLRGLATNYLGQHGGAAQPIQDDQPKVEQTSTWKPKTRSGDVLAARDPIGDVEVKQKVTQPQKTAQSKQHQANQTTAAQGASAAAQGANAAAKITPPQSSADSQKNGDNQQDQDGHRGSDKVELSPESQARAQNLVKQGVQTPTSSQPAKGSSEKLVGNYEVTTKAGGWNQTADVHPEGEIQDGEALRTYDKLDAMSDDMGVGMHKKDGTQAQSDYQNKLTRGDVVTPLNASQQQMLQQMRQPLGQAA